MRFVISGRKVEVTDSLKERVYKKLGKLEKFFKDDPLVQVTLSVNKERQKVEVTIPSSGVIYRAEETDFDLYDAIDKIVDLIERQMRKHKTHLEKKLKKGVLDTPFESQFSNLEEQEETEFQVVRVKKFTFKPMSVEEAILQMNLLGHQFFVFNNADSDSFGIVYKRKDGNYGLIEQE